MYNINAGLVPSYISDLIRPLVSEISDYPLRNNRTRNPVYPHPLDYGMALKMNKKTY